jgi:hypothetical protein
MTGTCAHCKREFDSPTRKMYCHDKCRCLAWWQKRERPRRLAYLTNKINVLTAERDKILAEGDTKGLL